MPIFNIIILKSSWLRSPPSSSPLAAVSPAVSRRVRGQRLLWGHPLGHLLGDLHIVLRAELHGTLELLGDREQMHRLR